MLFMMTSVKREGRETSRKRKRESKVGQEGVNQTNHPPWEGKKGRIWNHRGTPKDYHQPSKLRHDPPSSTHSP